MGRGACISKVEAGGENRSSIRAKILALVSNVIVRLKGNFTCLSITRFWSRK